MKDNGHSSIAVPPSPPELMATTVIFGRTIPRCQFWRRATRVQCRKASLKDRKFCRRHRGNVVSIGPLNHNFRDGRWSMLLPVNLRASTPTTYTHRNEIALVDARLETLVRGIAEDAGTFGGGLRARYDRLHAAMTSGDSDEIRASLMAHAWTRGYHATCFVNEHDPNPLEAVSGTAETALQRMRELIEARLRR